jgi:hypothetical protein
MLQPPNTMRTHAQVSGRGYAPAQSVGHRPARTRGEDLCFWWAYTQGTGADIEDAAAAAASAAESEVSRAGRHAPVHLQLRIILLRRIEHHCAGEGIFSINFCFFELTKR